MQILVLESSTSNSKALLYSTEAGVMDMAVVEYLPENNSNGTQDAEGVFRQTAELGRRLCEGHKIDLIVLGNAFHSVLLCDRNMKPVTRVYSWAWTEPSELCNRLREDKEYTLKYYKNTGCMVNAIYPAFKLLYFKEKGYPMRDYYIFGQGDYNTFRLTGQRIVTDCMVSGSGLLNIHTKKYYTDILDQIGITEDQLCRLVTYKETVPLSKEGAELLGLQPGIPVMPPCGDGALNQVGVGALKEGVMTFSVGTSAALRLTTHKPLIPDEPSTWCYLSPVTWMSGAATSGACNSTDWYKENFYNLSYSDIEKNSSDVKDTPIFLPFLFGERCPGWQDERKGAFVNIQPHHNNRDFYCAVQEGILFNLYQCYKVLCRLNGTPGRIILSGGIVHSVFWTQMCADIFGADMEIPEIGQSSLMGAVVLGLEKLGYIRDLNDFSFPVKRIVRPNPDKKEFYARKFEEYMYWYNKLSSH